MTRRRRPATLALPALAVGVAFAWWEGTESRGSSAAHWSVGLSVALVLAGSVAVGRQRQRERSWVWARSSAHGVRKWRDAPSDVVGSTVLWAALAVAIVGWGVGSFVAQAHDLPTFSYLVGRITRWHWGRSLVFAGWLVLGTAFAAWHRTSAP